MDHFTPFSSQPEASKPPEPADDEIVGAADQSAAQPQSNKSSVDADRQSRMDYMKIVAPPRRSGSRGPLIIAGAVIIVLLIGLGAWLGLHHNSKAAPKKASATIAQVPATKTTSSGSANYTANGQDLNLSFNYPSSWSVSPASGTDTTDQAITLNSPLTTIASATGSSVTGKVTLSIRPGNATLTELASGNATAAQNSVQFAYTKPAADQHQYPYLTFIHLPTTGNPSGAFQEVLVTGTTSFSSGNSLTAASISVDPIISASFYDCTSTTCASSGATPLNITDSTWQNAAIFQQTLAIFESLQLN